MTQQLHQLLEQAQMYQQQLQGLLAQKEGLKLQAMEMDSALEELGKTAESGVYKAAGPLLIRVTVAAAQKELAEKKDLLDVQIKAVEKGEKRLKEKLDELKSRLSASAKDKPAGGG